MIRSGELSSSIYHGLSQQDIGKITNYHQAVYQYLSLKAKLFAPLKQ